MANHSQSSGETIYECRCVHYAWGHSYGAPQRYLLWTTLDDAEQAAAFSAQISDLIAQVDIEPPQEEAFFVVNLASERTPRGEKVRGLAILLGCRLRGVTDFIGRPSPVYIHVLLAAFRENQVPQRAAFAAAMVKLHREVYDNDDGSLRRIERLYEECTDERVARQKFDAFRRRLPKSLPLCTQEQQHAWTSAWAPQKTVLYAGKELPFSELAAQIALLVSVLQDSGLDWNWVGVNGSGLSQRPGLVVRIQLTQNLGKYAKDAQLLMLPTPSDEVLFRLLSLAAKMHPPSDNQAHPALAGWHAEGSTTDALSRAPRSERAPTTHGSVHGSSSQLLGLLGGVGRIGGMVALSALIAAFVLFLVAHHWQQERQMPSPPIQLEASVPQRKELPPMALPRADSAATQDQARNLAPGERHESLGPKTAPAAAGATAKTEHKNTYSRRGSRRSGAGPHAEVPRFYAAAAGRATGIGSGKPECRS